MKVRVDIILPAHNESGNIMPIYEGLVRHVDPEEFAYRILFVDDGSTDSTLQEIMALSEKDERVKYISLSRNFGHQNAIKAGLDCSDAEVAIMMDCDMQHPPDLITQMLQKFREGYDVVRTYRRENRSESYIKRKTSSLFYTIVSSFSEVKIEKGSADFRLVSGKALQHLKSFNEFDLFYRGLVKWIGFRQISIVYQPNDRLHGESKYSFVTMVRFGLKGFTSFSTKPLYVSAYIGMIVSLISVLYLPYIAYAFFIGHSSAGWASILVTVAFFGGLNLMILGIIGIYISKLFLQSKARPHYIVHHSNL